MNPPLPDGESLYGEWGRKNIASLSSMHQKKSAPQARPLAG
jgi:hypothetical protein